MSLQKPHLLAAVSALACRSAFTQGVRSIGETSTATLIDHYHSLGLRGLREAMSGQVGEESLVATSLMLCLGEIYAGGDDASIWVVHLRGAKALMAEIGSLPSATDTNYSDQREVLSLLNHLFLGIVFQAGLRADQECCEWIPTRPVSLGEYYLDEWLGFSSELIPIYQSICQVARNDRQACFFEGEAMLRKLDTMQMRDRENPPQLRPILQNITTHAAYSQFLLSNQAYQWAAKIHVYRRLFGLPSSAPEVQHAVQKILQCMEQMIQGQGKRPWITMVMPTFVAGCEAQDEISRAAAASSLRRLEKAIGAGNIRHVRKVMERSWEAHRQHEDEDEYSATTTALWSTRTVQGKYDFITF